MSAEIMSTWTIFQSPLDHPGKIVVRRFAIGMLPEPVAQEGYVVDTLDEARDLLPDGLFCMGRDPNDHVSVVETWL